MSKIDLDTPLLSLSKSDAFTIRDACQGVLDLGGTGSGKTSGSGKALALAMLRAGMGGLVHCAKPEEATLWRAYCHQAGRTKSVIEFDGTNWAYNFIAHELARLGGGGLNAIVECLMRVLEIARNASPGDAREGEVFWTDTLRQALRNSLPILYAATGTVRIRDILEFARGSPRSPEEMQDERWQSQSPFFHLYTQAAPRLDDETGSRTIAYWRNDFATLDPKTRGNILISLTTALDRFNHGWLARAFCEGTTIVPELTFHGAIIILNMPALTRNEDGIIAQQLFKYMWQRTVLTRNALPKKQQERPVFLYADEAQYFINSYDAEFLSTCRGSRCCTVFLSQNLPTFYAKIGGANAHDRVHHLLGNFGTKVWHNNSCAETNEWAAKTLGRILHRRGNASDSYGVSSNWGQSMNEGRNWGSSSQSGGGGSTDSKGGSSSNSNWSVGLSSGHSDGYGLTKGRGSSSNQSRGYAEQMDWQMEPGDFARVLKTGGPTNRNRVSAVWFQAGRQFTASGGNALMVEFKQ